MLGEVVTENGKKKIRRLTADAGAGNLVGTIIVVCSNQIPSNYLPLATQYDTSLYPVLYALLGTDTTPTASALGLPTLTSGQYAIKATSGLSENAQDNVVAQIFSSLGITKVKYGRVQLGTGTHQTINIDTGLTTLRHISISPSSSSGIYPTWYITRGYETTPTVQITYTNTNSSAAYLNWMAFGD